MATVGATIAALPKPWFGVNGRRALWVAIAALTVMVLLSLAVFPVRQYLAQRSETATREHTLAQLRAENDRLQARVDALIGATRAPWPAPPGPLPGPAPIFICDCCDCCDYYLVVLHGHTGDLHDSGHRRHDIPLL